MILREQLLEEATEAYNNVRQAYQRDRQNPDLAVKCCQAAAALSAVMNDCTPPQPDPVVAATNQAQLALLQEVAGAFKSVQTQIDAAHAYEADGGLVFEVYVIHEGPDPDLVRLMLREAGNPFVTQQAEKAMSMARSLVAAGAVVQINVINPTAMNAAAAVASDEASGAASDEASGAAVASDEAAVAAVASDEAAVAASDEASVAASDEAAVASDEAADGGEE